MKVFIASSSSNSIPDRYLDDCKNYLNELFIKDYDLVFGACNEGIMGLSYNQALKNGRNIIGICPNAYKNDLLNLQCNKAILTHSISDRTEQLINESDVLLFLPGGIGTIYELFTAIERKRNNEVDKPIIIYNCQHFFDKMMLFLNDIYKEGFTDEKVKTCYHISDSCEDTITYIKSYCRNKEYVKN